MVRLQQFLDSWKAIREDTAQAVEDFPATELDYRPVPDVDSFRTIVRHILNAGDGLTGVLVSGDEDYGGAAAREKMRPYWRPIADDAPAPELAAALRQSVADWCDQLAAKPPEFFAGIVTRHFDGAKLTRMEMLHFIKEHELTHRSQLFMYLRLKGVVPSTTRRRLARQAAK